MKSFARWLMGAGVGAVGLLGTVFAGCEPEEEDTLYRGGDGGTEGGPTVGDLRPDAGCHLDCIGELFCKAGVGDSGLQLFREFTGPVACASAETATRALCRDVGSAEGLSCGDSECNPFGLRDSRYAGCAPDTEIARSPSARLERLYCLKLPAEGSACQEERDCHPMVNVVDGNLRCTEGRCVAVPRPSAETLKVCRSIDGRGCTTVCGTAYETTLCLVDEECPTGMDCARKTRSTSCTGVCLPRTFGRNLDTPVCP
jgi:hypothetical protein